MGYRFNSLIHSRFIIHFAKLEIQFSHCIVVSFFHRSNNERFVTKNVTNLVFFKNKFKFSVTKYLLYIVAISIILERNYIHIYIYVDVLKHTTSSFLLCGIISKDLISYDPSSICIYVIFAVSDLESSSELRVLFFNRERGGRREGSPLKRCKKERYGSSLMSNGETKGGISSCTDTFDVAERLQRTKRFRG